MKADNLSIIEPKISIDILKETLSISNEANHPSGTVEEITEKEIQVEHPKSNSLALPTRNLITKNTHKFNQLDDEVATLLSRRTHQQ